MKIKISLLVTLSLISFSELYAIKGSPTRNEESRQSHHSYTISKNDKSIYQNLLLTKEKKERAIGETKLKYILPTNLQQHKYHEEKCYAPYKDKSSLPIGCIKIKIKKDIERI